MVSPETVLIVGIAALVIFGGRKLPELGKGLGQGIRAFKSGLNDKDEEEKVEAEKKGEVGRG